MPQRKKYPAELYLYFSLTSLVLLQIIFPTDGADFKDEFDKNIKYKSSTRQYGETKEPWKNILKEMLEEYRKLMSEKRIVINNREAFTI